MDSLSAALEHLFDYAGLFPPASLPLERVLIDYAACRRGRDRWLLGRLIVPVQQLERLPPLAEYADGWPISVLVKDGDAIPAAATVIADFRARHGASFRVEAVEVPLAASGAISAAAEALPGDLERFIEIPTAQDPAPFVEAIAAAGCSAKVRTGGLDAAAFPSVGELARFIERCRASRVSFKATAGLHHAVRSSHPFSGEPGTSSGPMHGFVNLAVAAALRSAMQVDEAGTARVLGETEPGSFRFGGRVAACGPNVVTTTEIDFARKTLLRSIGSCSIDEPAAELRALGWGARAMP